MPDASAPSAETADFARLSGPQVDALCNVAFGGSGMGCNRRTLATLEAKGLIERYDVSHADRFGTFTIHKWSMPIPVHAAFCAWCAEVYAAPEPVEQP